MKIETVNPCEEVNWDQQILKFPGSGVFHGRAWARVLQDGYGLHPLYLVARDGHGDFAGCLPLMEARSPLTGKRGVALPFTDNVPLLARDVETGHCIIRAAFDMGRERHWQYLEFKGARLNEPSAWNGPLSPRRGEGVEGGVPDSAMNLAREDGMVSSECNPSERNLNSLSLPKGEGQGEGSPSPRSFNSTQKSTLGTPNFSPDPGPPSTAHRPPAFAPELRRGKPSSDLWPLTSSLSPSLSYYHHTLNLRKTEAELLAGMEDSTRRAIRKADKSGVRVEFSQSAEAMESFCRLHALTRRGHGLPPQPDRFFRALHENLIASGHGQIILAKVGDHCLGASVFLTHGSKVLFKFGASDPARQALRPNNAVMWQAIKHYAGQGFEELDFGRCSLPNAGLRRFKNGFGAAETTIHYYKYDYGKAAFVSDRDLAFSWVTKVFGLMPLWASRMVGNVLYKHLA